MNTAEGVLDWTTGTAGVAYQHCPACASNWAFRRTFCPRCGSVSPETRQASGDGVVYAVTTVTRAPTDEFRALAPYATVQFDNGSVRQFDYGQAPNVQIGDRVRADGDQLYR